MSLETQAPGAAPVEEVTQPSAPSEPMSAVIADATTYHESMSSAPQRPSEAEQPKPAQERVRPKRGHRLAELLVRGLAKRAGIEVRRRGEMVADDVIASEALSTYGHEGLEHASRDDRQAVERFAAERTPRQLSGITEEEISALPQEQQDQLHRVVTEMQVAILAGQRQEKGFSDENNGQVVVRRGADGTISVVGATSINGEKIAVGKHGEIIFRDATHAGRTLEYHAVAATIGRDGTTRISGSETTEVRPTPSQHRHEASEANRVRESVSTAFSNPLVVERVQVERRVTTVDLGAQAKAVEEAANSSRVRGHEDTAVVPEPPTVTQRIDVVRVRRLRQEGGAPTTGSRLDLDKLQVSDGEKAVYDGDESLREAARMIDPNVPERYIDRMATTERIPVVVTQEQHDLLMSVVPSRRAQLLAEQLGVDSAALQYDLLVDSSVPVGARPENNRVLSGQLENQQLQREVDDQNAVVRLIQRGDGSINPTEGWQRLMILNPQLSAIDADTRIQTLIAERDQLPASEIPTRRDQLKTELQEQAGGDKEKLALVEKLVQEVYPLTPQERQVNLMESAEELQRVYAGQQEMSSEEVRRLEERVRAEFDTLVSEGVLAERMRSRLIPERVQESGVGQVVEIMQAVQSASTFEEAYSRVSTIFGNNADAGLVATITNSLWTSRSQKPAA